MGSVLDVVLADISTGIAGHIPPQSTVTGCGFKGIMSK